MPNAKDRWEFVLAGRKKHAWGKQRGLATATIDNIFGDKAPASWDSLRAAMLAENANPRWLGEGVGAPYLATAHLDSDAFADTMQHYLMDEPWNVMLATNHRIITCILHQPGVYTYGKKEIPHTIIEIHSGPLTRRLLPVLLPAAQAKRLQKITCDTKLLLDIASGMLGTYQLFGDDDKAGVLALGQPCNERDALTLFDDTEPQNTENLISIDMMRAIINMVESTALEESIMLTPAQKSKIVTAAYRHAQRLALDPQQLERSQILPLIETA